MSRQTLLPLRTTQPEEGGEERRGEKRERRGGGGREEWTKEKRIILQCNEKSYQIVTLPRLLPESVPPPLPAC